MTKARDVVRMSAAEAWAYMETQRDVHIATVGKDGAPHLTTNWFSIVDGHVVFTSYVASQKIVNLTRDSRISLLFSDGRTYPELRGVSVQGTAEFISDPAGRERYFAAVFERNLAFYGGIDTSVAKRAIAAGRRVCVRVCAKRIISWDHSKLGFRDEAAL
jgi:PPOX class probable F420-dependent enzyme